MASIKQIKRRLNSIDNTSKITNALYLISASKMQKAQHRAETSLLYTHALAKIVHNLGKDVIDYKSPLTRDVEDADVRNVAIVVIGTERGFVGGMINELTAKLVELKTDIQKTYPRAQISGISVFKTAKKILRYARITNTNHFDEYINVPTTTNLSPISSLLLNGFSEQEYDLVYIVSSEFTSLVKQEAVANQLLPLSIKELKEKGEKAAGVTEGRFVYEPDRNKILDKILPEYFETQLLTAVHSSIASEQSNRMVAMKNATDNAKDLSENLTQSYHKTRQTEITQELLEVSGSDQADHNLFSNDNFEII